MSSDRPHTPGSGAQMIIGRVFDMTRWDLSVVR